MILARATSLVEMGVKLSGLGTEAGRVRGLAYKPRSSDVFISPYAKCGTTWMQQIVHGLRTGGSMAFEEITEAVPWLEMAHGMGIDVDAPQAAEPHAFKSHLSWDRIPKGGRYIVVMRDPIDAMLSLHGFLEDWVFEIGSISVDEFALYYLARDPDRCYWGHAASWWERRDREEVLLFCYEHMKRDLVGTVDRVADFIGGDYDAATRALAVEQAGFDFMKRHAHQFDDHLLRDAWDEVSGIPPGGDSVKVSKGEAGRGAKSVSPEIRAKFAAHWRETMGVRFGLDTYEEMAGRLKM